MLDAKEPREKKEGENREGCGRGCILIASLAPRVLF